jgi:hypothetical protein
MIHQFQVDFADSFGTDYKEQLSKAARRLGSLETRAFSSSMLI